jgi:glycosidase
VAAASADVSSVLSAYRDAIRLRAEHPAMRSGAVDPAETGSDSVAAAIQTGGGETLLVVANVGADAVTDYALAVDESGLCGAIDPALVGGESAAAASPTAPTLDADGGFAGYRPIRELAAHSLTILSLGRADR